MSKTKPTLDTWDVWWNKQSKGNNSLSYPELQKALEETFQTTIQWNLQPLIDYKRDGNITLSLFKLFVRMFGWDQATLQKCKDIQTNGWFHPHFTKEEVTSHLLQKGVGFFMIRFRESLQQGASQWPENESIFVLTRVDPPASDKASPEIVHRLLYYSVSKKGFYIIKDEVYPTVNQLLEKEMSRGKIKYACCPGDPSSSQRLKMDEAEEVTYKGVIMFVEGFKPSGDCTTVLLQHKESIGVAMIDHIISNCQRWLKGFKQNKFNPYKLDDDEMIAVALYTFDLGFAGEQKDNLYFILNTMLRKRDPTALTAWKGYVYYLMRALDKFPDITASVYRGSSNLEFVKSEYKLGRSIHWSAFSSSSQEERVARMFAGKGGVVFRIQLFTAKDISAYSVIKSEKELLITPNMNLVVTRTVYTDPKDGLLYVDLLQQTDKLIN